MTNPIETLVKDNLLNHDFPYITDNFKLITGQNLKRGTLLGKITATGKLKQRIAASTDGSENAHSILVHDADATASELRVVVYLTGGFNSNSIGLDPSDTMDATLKSQLRDKNIYVKKAQGSDL